MDSQLRSNSSGIKSPAQPAGHQPGRSRVAARLEREVGSALTGDRSAVINATAAELLGEPGPVVEAVAGALGRSGVGVIAHWEVQQLIWRSHLHDDLINALTSSNPLSRAAAARVCGAARMTTAVIWMADMLSDSNPKVRHAAVRALGQMGGRRAVDALMADAERTPLYRLAISLSQAASDVDIEALMRAPANEDAALATVLAAGLRRDRLRVSPLLGIAHDRRWPPRVRVAACKALAAIGEPAAAESLERLAQNDPVERVKAAAAGARRRLARQTVAR